jgi:hypothetical protein
VHPVFVADRFRRIQWRFSRFWFLLLSSRRQRSNQLTRTNLLNFLCFAHVWFGFVVFCSCWRETYKRVDNFELQWRRFWGLDEEVFSGKETSDGEFFIAILLYYSESSVIASFVTFDCRSFFAWKKKKREWQKSGGLKLSSQRSVGCSSTMIERLVSLTSSSTKSKRDSEKTSSRAGSSSKSWDRCWNMQSDLVRVLQVYWWWRSNLSDGARTSAAIPRWWWPNGTGPAIDRWAFPAPMATVS